MPHLYVCEITTQMRVLTGEKWSESYIYKNLRKLGWSLQVVFEHDKQIDLQERANYLYALHYYVKHPKQILVLDETHSSRKSTMRRRYWSVQGQSPYLDCFLDLTVDSILHYVLQILSGLYPQLVRFFFRENGENDLNETRGTLDKKRFTQWGKQKLVPVLGKYILGQENSIDILDNSTIHYSEELVNLIEGARAKMIYLPPYSPDLNPIKLMFGI